MQREPLAKRSSLQRYCFSIAQGQGRAHRNKQRRNRDSCSRSRLQIVALVRSPDLGQFCKWLPHLSEVTSKFFQTPLVKRTHHLPRQVLVQFAALKVRKRRLIIFVVVDTGELSLVKTEAFGLASMRLSIRLETSAVWKSCSTT